MLSLTVTIALIVVMAAGFAGGLLVDASEVLKNLLRRALSIYNDGRWRSGRIAKGPRPRNTMEMFNLAALTVAPYFRS